MSRKHQQPYADSEVIAASRLSAAELERIGIDVAESLEAARERVAVAACREAARSDAKLPPAGNTGGKSSEEAPSPEIPARFVCIDGHPVEIPARRGWGGDAAFCDWINFTAKEEAFFLGSTPVTDNQVIEHVSATCLRLFGFGITSKRETGANFYRESYVLGDNYGLVCYGGQRNTVLVSLSGEGCAGARAGWEERLQDWLSTAFMARITRVDLAYDDFEGVLDIEDLDMFFDAGLFNCGGRNPDIEHRGNWKRPNGKGRTVYVGNRKNGKFFRGYEKGKQLGDPSSPWVRLETELKGVDREIPFDVLTRAGEYLAATYPALGFISQRQERILTTQKATEITYQAMCDWLKRQCGAALAVVLEVEGVEKFVEKCVRVGEMPKRLKFPDYRFSPESIETRPRVHLPLEVMLEAPFRNDEVRLF